MHVMDQQLIHRVMIYYTSHVSRATVRRDTMLYEKGLLLQALLFLIPLNFAFFASSLFLFMTKGHISSQASSAISGLYLHLMLVA